MRSRGTGSQAPTSGTRNVGLQRRALIAPTLKLLQLASGGGRAVQPHPLLLGTFVVRPGDEIFSQREPVTAFSFIPLDLRDVLSLALALHAFVIQLVQFDRDVAAIPSGTEFLLQSLGLGRKSAESEGGNRRGNEGAHECRSANDLAGPVAG